MLAAENACATALRHPRHQAFRRAGRPATTPAPAFRLVMTHCATDWDALRFNSQTGETWAPNTDRDPDWVWEKVPDPTPVPPSDYDLQVAYVLIEGKKLERLVRMNRQTGQAWTSTSALWRAVDEPLGFARAAVPTTGFQLVMTSSAASDMFCRFDPQSGATWRIVSAHGNDVWSKVADAGQLPASDYNLQLVSLVQDNVETVRGMRLDRKTGRGWFTSGQKWIAIDEPSTSGNMPAPAAGFRQLVKASSKFWYGYRFNPETGQTWVPSSSDGRCLGRTRRERPGSARRPTTCRSFAGSTATTGTTTCCGWSGKWADSGSRVATERGNRWPSGPTS